MMARFSKLDLPISAADDAAVSAGRVIGVGRKQADPQASSAQGVSGTRRIQRGPLAQSAGVSTRTDGPMPAASATQLSKALEPGSIRGLPKFLTRYSARSLREAPKWVPGAVARAGATEAVARGVGRQVAHRGGTENAVKDARSFVRLSGGVLNSGLTQRRAMLATSESLHKRPLGTRAVSRFSKGSSLEARRQRRLGMATAGLTGAGGAGVGYGAREIHSRTRSIRAIDGVKASEYVLSRRGAGLLAGGTGALAGAVKVSRYANSSRNRKYT